jgi:hypothetical protein
LSTNAADRLIPPAAFVSSVFVEIALRQGQAVA